MLQRPKTKNGPNAILLFKPFLCSIIIKSPNTAPKTNAKYKAINPFLNPSKSPMLNANLTSPNPIPRPLVIRNRNSIGNITPNEAMVRSRRILDVKPKLNVRIKESRKKTT